MAVGLWASTILARTLGAEDYGVVGIATVIIGFLDRFSDVGISAALVQRKSNDEQVLETAQALNLILAGTLFLCALIVAPFTVKIFNNRAVPQVVSVLAFGFLFSAIGFLPAALLTREMRFATLRTPSVAGTIIRGFVAVGCALAGWKHWSLVSGNLAGTFSTGMLLKVVRPIKVKWRINPKIGLELLRFGWPVWFSGLLIFTVFNVDNFVVGSLRGATQLGYYTVAWTWATFACNTVYEIVHSVLFPRFSRMQPNRDNLAAMYLRSLRVVMFAAVMVNAILFAVADGFLVTVLGKGNLRWLPALYPLQILCIYGAIRASMEPVGNVIMALGRPKLLLRAMVLPISLELCFLPLVAIKWGLEGVALLVCLAYALQWVVYGPFLKRELKVGPGMMLKFAFPVLAGAVLGVITSRAIPLVHPLAWQSIILRTGVTCAVFTIVHELLTGGGILSELRLVLKSRIPNTSD
jgi:PST family polysaccharide transporter